MSVRPSCDFFTVFEHRVLSSWLEVEPPSVAASIPLREALASLGIDQANDKHDSQLDAVVARIVLDTIGLRPRHLFTVGWPGRRSGLCSPMAYYLTWLPTYDHFVVTGSSSNAWILSHTDFAVGFFNAETGLVDGAREIILADWSARHETEAQPRWESFITPGLIGKKEARTWSDLVWGPAGKDLDAERPTVDELFLAHNETNVMGFHGD
jgi:hypothetical protein